MSECLHKQPASKIGTDSVKHVVASSYTIEDVCSMQNNAWHHPNRDHIIRQKLQNRSTSYAGALRLHTVNITIMVIKAGNEGAGTNLQPTSLSSPSSGGSIWGRT